MFSSMVLIVTLAAIAGTSNAVQPQVAAGWITPSSGHYRPAPIPAYPPPIPPRAVNVTTPEGHLLIGTPSQYDRLLFSQIVQKTASMWSGQEEKIKFPGSIPGGYLTHSVITSIRVYNQLTPSKHRRIKIKAGGYGRRNVTIKLKSDRNYGFKYLVQIYGR